MVNKWGKTLKPPARGISRYAGSTEHRPSRQLIFWLYFYDSHHHGISDPGRHTAKNRTWGWGECALPDFRSSGVLFFGEQTRSRKLAAPSPGALRRHRPSELGVEAIVCSPCVSLQREGASPCHPGPARGWVLARPHASGSLCGTKGMTPVLWETEGFSECRVMGN